LIEELRILFVHEVNYLTKPIFEMHEFPEHLAEIGHDVAFLHFPEGSENSPDKGSHWRKEVPGRVVPEVTLTLFSPRVQISGIMGRLIAAFRGHSIVRRTISDFKPDVIVNLAVPTFGWQIVREAKKRGIPIAYRALDVSHKIRNTVFEPLVKVAERFVIRNSDLVLANNPAIRDYCIQMGAQTERVAVVLPQMNIDMFRSARPSELRSRLGIGLHVRIVAYMGSFFYFSGLEQVLSRLSTMTREQKGDYVLLLIGGGEGESALRKLVEDERLSHQVIFTGFVSFAELPEFIGSADALINPMKPDLVSNSALPNKLIQYLSTNAQVVSTKLDGAFSVLAGVDGMSWADSPEECIEIALSKRDLKLSKERLSARLSFLRENFGESNLGRFEAELLDLMGAK
jgi:glycosyltransferase involved in cell wall biosynthesis